MEPRDPEPTYVPVHRVPVWLSSEDVRQAISEVVAQIGSDDAKAFGWDMMCAITALSSRAGHPIEEKPHV
jgi:hypothetical protein